jgi:hypothetical protein
MHSHLPYNIDHCVDYANQCTCIQPSFDHEDKQSPYSQSLELYSNLEDVHLTCS